jgi:hypothetical protein
MPPRKEASSSAAKRVVLEVLASLPDDCSLQDVADALQERLDRRGGRDRDLARLEEHDEVMRQARKYLDW